MVSEVMGIGERLHKAGVGLRDAVAVIHMTLEEQSEEMGELPREWFQGLHDAFHRTVHGTRIERHQPMESDQRFHVFEIRTEEGDSLGYLNMIYLRKPLPCYYLVYVEVSAPFRGQGLGTRILETFRSFLADKGAVGLLDNIIPPDEPTFGMYEKLGYCPIERFLGRKEVNGDGRYMVWLPAAMRFPDLSERLAKLLFNLKRKRSVIDMRDNEAMVKRTIEEFRSVYDGLVRLFDSELHAGVSTPLMRFMFTKFITKLVGFRRRIALLLGYTGGESLEQIEVADWIRRLPLQPYSLWGGEAVSVEVWEQDPAMERLPAPLREDATGFIEELPLYRRPYLVSRSAGVADRETEDFRISDLLELGFDPTRLREWTHDARGYVFERTSPRLLSLLRGKARLLKEVAGASAGRRFRTARLRVNPPLGLISHRGNLYVPRRKVEGIHVEEALDQLRTSSLLREMNRTLSIDRIVLDVVDEIRQWLDAQLGSRFREEKADLTFFVPWDLCRNMPRVSVDAAGPSLDEIWIA